MCNLKNRLIPLVEAIFLTFMRSRVPYTYRALGIEWVTYSFKKYLHIDNIIHALNDEGSCTHP